MFYGFEEKQKLFDCFVGRRFLNRLVMS